MLPKLWKRSINFPSRIFWNFSNSFYSFFFFFEGQKVKYLSHLFFNHSNFFSESFCSNHQQVLKKSIQPQGEPQKHYIGDVWPKKFSYTKFHYRQNDRKGRYTLAHFGEKLQKKWSHRIGKHRFWLVTLWLNFFLQFSQKCAKAYRPFRSFSLLWIFL